MKRIICLIIAVVLCLSAFTSCDTIEGVITDLGNNVFISPEEKAALDSALEYLSTMYKGLEGTHDKDFDVVSQAVIGGVKYPITWTVDNDEVSIKDSVKFGFKTIDIPSNPKTDLEFTLTAKITSNNSWGSRIKNFKIKVLSAESASNLSIPDAIELGKAQGSGKYTEAKYSLSGTIGEFYGDAGTTYGNFYLLDDSGNQILIYGSFDVEGNRYDSMSTKPTTGDKVTVYGVVGNFNGTPQLKDVTFTMINGVEYKIPTGGISLTFDALSNRVSADENSQVWKANGITFTNDKAGSSSAVNKDYYNPVRLYKNSTITVEYTGMRQIKFVCAAKDQYNDYPTTLNSALTDAGYSTSVKGAIITVVLPEGTNSITVTLAAGQVRLYKIEVSTTVTETTPGGSQGGSGTTVYNTPEEIVNAAYALANNTSLPGGSYTLTGVISEIEKSTSDNITLWIVVNNMNDKPLQCYHLSGNGFNLLKVGDTITVTGAIKNFYTDYNNKSTIEFDSPTLDSYVFAQTADADKVADAKEDVEIVKSIYKDSTITLPTTSARHSSVSITWAITEDANNSATLTNATLAIALKDTASTLKLTATIESGSAKDTLVVEVALNVKPAEGAPETDGRFTEETAYYLSAIATDNTVYYFTGSISNGKGSTTTDKNAAIKIFIDIVDGGYYVYSVDANNVKTYYSVGTSSTSFTKGSEPVLMTWNDTYSTLQGDSGRMFWLYGNNNELRTYSSNNGQDTNVPCSLVIAN